MNSSQPPTSEVMPIGKHKGKSIAEVMAVDPNYVQWLILQPWFVEKYKLVYNFIVQAGPPSEMTPEHNAMQAKFLDDEFCLRMAKWARPQLFDKTAIIARLGEPYKSLLDMIVKKIIEKKKQLEWARSRKSEREQDVKDCQWHIDKIEAEKIQYKDSKKSCLSLAGDLEDWKQRKAVAEKNVEHYLTEINEREAKIPYYESLPTFTEPVRLLVRHEVKNRAMEAIADVWFEVKMKAEWKGPRIIKPSAWISSDDGSWDEHNYPGSTSAENNFLIEVKPSLGDDYPAVLRQMRDQKRRRGTTDERCPHVLCYGEFSATGATLDQVKKIFAEARILMVSMKEVEVMALTAKEG